jgi:hypothetical protein
MVFFYKLGFEYILQKGKRIRTPIEIQLHTALENNNLT